MLRVNAINRQELLKCLTFNPKSLVFKTVSAILKWDTIKAGHTWPALYLSERNQAAARTCSLATIGTQEGRIAHHHTDATVPHIVALLGFSFHVAKIESIIDNAKEKH